MTEQELEQLKTAIRAACNWCECRAVVSVHYALQVYRSIFKPWPFDNKVGNTPNENSLQERKICHAM